MWKLVKRMLTKLGRGIEWFLGFRGHFLGSNEHTDTPREALMCDPRQQFNDSGWHKMSLLQGFLWLSRYRVVEYERLKHGDLWGAFAVRVGDSEDDPPYIMAKVSAVLCAIILTCVAMFGGDGFVAELMLTMFMLTIVIAISAWGIGGIRWLIYKKSSQRRLETLRENIEPAYTSYLRHFASREMLDSIQYMLTGKKVDLDRPEMNFAKLRTEVESRRAFFSDNAEYWSRRMREHPACAETYEKYRKQAQEEVAFCNESLASLDRQIELVRKGYNVVREYIGRIEPNVQDMILAALQNRLVEQRAQLEQRVQEFAAHHLRAYMAQMMSMHDALKQLTDEVVASSLNTIPQLNPRELAGTLVTYEEKLEAAVRGIQQQQYASPIGQEVGQIADAEPELEPV